MDKKLTINGKNVKIERGEKILKVNNKNLEEIICEALPEDIKNYEDYLGNISISIDIYENGELVTESNYSGD